MKHYESISEYNDVLYESSPVSVNDYLSDKYNIVHNELYNDALNKYLNEQFSKYVNAKLLYCMFFLMKKYDNRNTMVDDIYDNIPRYINTDDKILYMHEILKYYDLKKNVLYELVEYIDSFILNIKNYIIDNAKIKNIKDHISYIISLTIYNISDFRAYVENNVLILSENEKYCIMSEETEKENRFLFIFENDDETILNIGFDRDGDLAIKLSDTNAYSFLDNENESIINSAMTKKNISLLESIMNIFLRHYKKDHRIIELKNIEYWMPSEIIIINNKMPFNKIKVSLEPYWNFYQKHDEYNIEYLKIIKDNNLTDSEVTEIDYVNGKAKMHARMDDIKYNIPFKYLNDKSLLSEDLSLKNTFIFNL